ncbi:MULTISPECIES: glycosyltransferase family 39 protein [unclassified Pseudomonas]|uniref:ArnT family glycosyltransferase n=1 Tax=unclassified Pseudomonas TaxID=196821 RepID=UPI000A1DA804|nr:MULTISPECIES: glycosyltransferase family 39 protein [unclassified Pseudomonas]
MKTHSNERKALALLLGVSTLILLLGLGSRELWGPETRWANIVLQMLQSGDYFDPYLKGSPYYDKPLPSYWLIVASTWLTGGLGHWSLRLSSVLAAWLSIWLVYRLGEQLLRKGTGLIAGWMLATTFYFIFWARVATADILTVCGVLAAVWWYWRGPEDTRLGRYTVFFLILAITSLLKGLIGFVLPGLILLPHLLAQGRWKRHLNLRLALAILLAGALYMVPFLLSHLYGTPHSGESGLSLVFRENVVRFFEPFDHVGPIYTYLVYLPLYTLPWAPCWILGLWVATRHWRQLHANERWLVWALGLLFLFFTASGSRRSYYVLPLVPFAQLLGAWWLSRRLELARDLGRERSRGWNLGLASAAMVMLLVLGLAYPWSNGGGGVLGFAAQVKAEASRIAPWNQWRMVMVEVDNKLPMYVQNQGAPFYYVPGNQDFPKRGTSADFMAWLERTSGQHWDPQRTLIFVAQDNKGPQLLEYLGDDHQVIRTQPTNGERLAGKPAEGNLAFIPHPATE